MPEVGNLLNSFKILLFYLSFLVFPHNLHMQHNLGESAFIFNMPFLISVLIFSGLILFILKMDRQKHVIFGLLWFIIFLFPFLGILNINPDAQIAEHWLYLPSFGIFLIGGALMAKINSKMAKVIIPVLFISLGLITALQNNTWNSDLTLYRYTLRFHPQNSKLHYNLGNAYLRKGLIDEAEEEYRSSLLLDPNYVYALNNLGIVLEKKGKIQDALLVYEKAASLNENFNQAKENIKRLKPALLSWLEQTFLPSCLAQDIDYAFDQSLYGEVLSLYLKDGLVDYRALKKDPQLLLKYLKKVASLAPAELETMSDEKKIAFYVNAYNALTLKVIIDHYPVKSIRDIPGVWDRIKFKVAGRKLTLNYIEHKILRPKFKEPRVHFALVCASGGCPELRDKPFTGSTLDKDLSEETKRFLNDRSRNYLDKEERVLYLSSIFSWFKKDFNGVIEFISNYLPQDQVLFIKEKKPKIKYQYDWSLNER